MSLSRVTEGPETDSPELPKPILLDLPVVIHRYARTLRACLEGNDGYNRHPHLITPARSLHENPFAARDIYEYVDSNGDRLIFGRDGITNIQFAPRTAAQAQAMLDELAADIRSPMPEAL